MVELSDEFCPVVMTPVETEAQITEDIIRQQFKDDPEAWKILDLIFDGYKAAEIREKLSLRDDVYNAARKRVSRKVQLLMPRELRLPRKGKNA